MALLELKNVSHIYHSPEGETSALKDVTFTVDEREFVSIVGPSGCGKSTILAILAGLLTPSAGEVSIGGSPLNEAKGTTALMPQRDQLFEWRSIMRNVLLGPEIQKTKTPETIEYAKTLLKKYGLIDFTTKRPSELSGGMRQRAALIRTLVTAPKLLLLDEPFSALDFQTRLQVCDDVADIIKQENKTAILVTHDINEAISMSDKVIVLTERPASVKKIYSIDLDKSLPPLKRREQKSFAVYFRRIWKDLEVLHE
ncbi:MAG: ABC transporter ATP-binding protein [Clostridia bacterium]|nr:ABC transporter ATP-binding protein [Clostridia bacterium]